MIRREIDVKRAPTKSQIKMLEAAERHPICFDEDCPELADDDLVKFKKITDPKSGRFDIRSIAINVPHHFS